jgi:hypothetical protein
MCAVGVVWVIEQHYASAGEWNEMAAIGLLEHRLVGDELCGDMGNDAFSEGDHIVEALRGAGEIVRRSHNRAATGRLGVKDVHDLLLRRGIYAGDRLIEQIDLWVRSDRPRQENPATLTT